MIDAATLKAAFAGFTGDKMLRAWRNRSPVTCSYWTARARILLGTDASLDAVWKLAAALYAACGEYVWTDGTFRAETLAMVAWQGIACRVFDTTIASLHPGPTIVLAAPSGT
jgi:hypothetical protein